MTETDQKETIKETTETEREVTTRDEPEKQTGESVDEDKADE